MSNALAVSPERTEADTVTATTCDLCGTEASRVVAEATDRRCRTVICDECGLLQAAPRLSPEEMDQLYEGFMGDAGAKARAVEGRPAEHRLEIEMKRAKTWAMEIVQRYLPLQGQRVLEFRCRSGALSHLMAAEGAQVVSVDPFPANLQVAKEERGLTEVVCLPITSFHQFEIPGPFDAVIGLTEHVLAHVLSPREMLENILQKLKPGGYLILDDKDVLQPRQFRSSGPLDTGRLHQYYFTPRTMEDLVRAVGFEIVECKIDPKRRSSHRHIHLVARKPLTPSAPPERPWRREAGPGVPAVCRRLRWLQRTWGLRRTRAGVKKSIRRQLKRMR